MGGIYEVRRWDGLRCHDIYIYTKFHKDWLRHSEVNMRDSQIHRQHGDCMCLLSFFQNKETKLIKRTPYVEATYCLVYVTTDGVLIAEWTY
jgi:hypothetical protein